MMREKLIGRTIVDYVETVTGIVITLNDGEKVEIAVSLHWSEGADGGLYQDAVLEINGITIARV